jgi:hypothetical protein
MSQPISPNKSLTGAWKLMAQHFEFADNGERVDVFGSAPRGRVLMTGDGDFMTIITAADRAALGDAAQLFATMLAYSGKFRIEGDRLVISCDLSWFPDWVGTDQVRFFHLDGDRLRLRSGNQTHPRYPDRPGYAVIELERES